MASVFNRMDDLVKDYLLFRGFTTTVKSLDNDIKTEREKGLKADKILEQLLYFVGCSELQHMREYWTYLNDHFFSRLEHRYSICIRKFEVSLFKLFIVNAYQNNRQDSVREFFEKLGRDLQNQQEFRDWFAFPFVSNPAESATFALYFTKQWQDTLQLSLYNFLQVVLQAMPLPTLINFDHDYRRMRALQEENEILKHQIRSSETGVDKKLSHNKPYSQIGSLTTHHSPDLVYDFSGLAEEAETLNEKQKPLRRFPINLSLKRTKQETRLDSVFTHETPKERIKSKVFVSQTGPNVTITASQFGQQVTNISSVSHGGSQAVNLSVSQSGLTNTIFSSATDCLSSQAGSQMCSQNVNPVSNIAMSASDQLPKAPSNCSSETKLDTDKNCNSTREKVDVSLEMSIQEPESSPGQQQNTNVPESHGKVTRELTSFPPYNSPMSEIGGFQPVVYTEICRTGSSEAKSSSVAMAETKLLFKTTELPESKAGITENRGEESNNSKTDELLKEIVGEHCPFFMLSEEEYLEHQSAVCYSRFSMSGQHVASLDVDGVVKVWSWSPQPSTTATIMSRAPFLSLDWASKSDRWLLLGNKSGQIRLFDTREIKTFKEAIVDPPNARVIYLSTSPSTMTFACCVASAVSSNNGGMDIGRLVLWDLKTMKQDRILIVESAAVTTCCIYSNSGQLLLAGGADGMLRVFDTGQQKCVTSWRAHRGPIQTISFGHDESSCFTMGLDGKLCEWSLTQSGHQLHKVNIALNYKSVGSQSKYAFPMDSSLGQLFCLSNDHKCLLTSINNKGIICKTPTTNEGMVYLMDLKPHEDIVTTVDWSPNMETPVCLTGSRDGRLKISTLLLQ